jgi:hypothetical protein
MKKEKASQRMLDDFDALVVQVVTTVERQLAEFKRDAALLREELMQRKGL